MSGTKTTMGLSWSTEDYLRLIYELGDDGQVVGVSALAEQLGISAASVTGMAKRLAKAGLVRRTPYRRLSLTGEGRKAALGVVRRHRLIELYMVEALGYSWDEVREEAERLEHAASDGFVDRLDRLLGHPEADAHGSPIPTREGEVVEKAYVPLAGLDVGERAVLRRVLESRGLGDAVGAQRVVLLHELSSISVIANSARPIGTRAKAQNHRDAGPFRARHGTHRPW